ncbi:MAG: hypothetical protein ACE5E6_03920 [Phycisphaerae bacterium]
MSRVGIAVALAVACGAAACRTPGPAATGARGNTKLIPPRNEPPVSRVVCIYDRDCWLNLDAAGDRDPEGFHFKAFLKISGGKSVLRDGTFNVRMYALNRTTDDVERKLVSDWHYTTSDVGRIGRPGIMGDGYALRLRWASKDIAGTEVEIVTSFEDRYGRRARSETKRIRVPKYTS